MKRFRVVLMLMIVSLVLVACGSGNSSDKLIIYSNAISEGRGDWITAEAAKEGFELELVDIGGSALVDRIIAEKNNPVADIVIGSNQMGFEKMKAADALEEFKPSWADLVPEGFNDVDGKYYSYEQIAILMIYNQSKVSAEDAPKSWNDLAVNDKYNNMFWADAKLTGGTIQVLIGSILSDYRDPNGDLGISQEGWDTIQSYFNTGYQAVEGDDFQGLVATGDVPITRMWSNGMKTLESDFEQTFGVVKPEGGVPYVVEQVGILKGSKKQDKAKEFLDWFGSAEVRAEYAVAKGSVPVIVESQDSSDLRMHEILSDLPQKELDWEFITKNIDSWVEKIELELRD